MKNKKLITFILCIIIIIIALVVTFVTVKNIKNASKEVDVYTISKEDIIKVKPTVENEISPIQPSVRKPN